MTKDRDEDTSIIQQGTQPADLAAYSDLFERLLDCVFLLDPETHQIIQINPACERLLRVPDEEIQSKNISFWFDHAQTNNFNRALRIAMRRYYPYQFDISCQLHFGRNVVLEILACPLRLSENQWVLQVIVRDVTFRREAEIEMQNLLKELQAANQKLAYLTTIDEMTGLYNFRHFRAQLSVEHARSMRETRPYCIIFCDIDFFKMYNDLNGHPAGDQLLSKFGKILLKCCRATDVVSRYGGEEFAVVCPNTNLEGAMLIGERIRRSVEESKFLYHQSEPGSRVTVSIGVSTFPKDGDDPETVLQSSDDALYHSKSTGRNRVSTYDDLKKFQQEKISA